MDELLAFARVFGAPRPLFSVKGGMGHTLGAAGLAGALLGLEALRRGRIPPTVGLEQVAADARGWASTTAVPVSWNWPRCMRGFAASATG